MSSFDFCVTHTHAGTQIRTHARTHTHTHTHTHTEELLIRMSGLVEHNDWTHFHFNHFLTQPVLHSLISNNLILVFTIRYSSKTHPASSQLLTFPYLDFRNGDVWQKYQVWHLIQCYCPAETWWHFMWKSIIQGETDVRVSSVELILIRGEMQDKETSKDTKRKVIHTPSLQRAWTSCPAVRKKKSGEVISPTQNILYSPAFWSHLSSLTKISKGLNQSFWWPSKFKVHSHTIHKYRVCYMDAFRSVLHQSLEYFTLSWASFLVV